MRSFGAVRELVPNQGAISSLNGTIGAVRFAQNILLSEVKRYLESQVKQSWSSISLHTLWRSIRQDVAPWYSEYSKEAYQFGAERLALGLDKFYKCKIGERAGKSGFPSFRKRGNNDSAKFTSAVLRAGGAHVHLPRIGEVRLKEPMHLQLGQRITAVTVRPRAGRWFATFWVREDGWTAPLRVRINSVIGIDLGIGERIATLSNGVVIANPRFFRSDELKLRHANKSLSRKKRGSSNRMKAIVKLRRVHFTVACRRADFIHKLTTDLVKSHDEIVIEDLAIKNMSRNLRLGKSFDDVAAAQIRHHLTYKCIWYGKTLTVVSRWFPSSKMCSTCGKINSNLTLKDRVWVCPCGAQHDRDINAAINLAGSSSVPACRPESADLPRKVKLLVGQEQRSIPICKAI